MKVISVVSGKGGSGKSLLTAVLGRAVAREGQRVLLIDLDIFVRGLTVLLSNFRRPQGRVGQHTTSSLLGIFPNSSKERGPTHPPLEDILIQRFFECDVLPAVDNVSAPLDYDDQNLSSEDFCSAVLERLLRQISPQYDYAFIDNRAGMDSLIAASCRLSDLVISIAEDDEVGRQTNVNLIRFVQNRRLASSVYSIINKGRGVRTLEDIESRHSSRSDFGVLGVVPFDMEILEGFGKQDFWSNVNSTLYFRAVLKAWNELTRLEDVVEISMAKYRFAPSIFMRESQGRFTLIERVLRVYSVLFLAGGVAFWVYDKYADHQLNTLETTSIISVAFGVFSLLLSTTGFLSSFKSRTRRLRGSED